MLKEIYKGEFLTKIAKLTQVIIIYPLILDVLGSEEKGLLSYQTSTLQLFVILVSMGMNVGINRIVQGRKTEFAKSKVISSGAIFIIFTSIFSIILIYLFKKELLSDFLYVIIILFYPVLSFSLNLLPNLGYFKIYYNLILIQVFLNILISCVFVFYQQSSGNMLFLSYSYCTIMIGFFSFIYLKYNITFHRTNLKRLRFYLSVGFLTWINGSFMWIVSYADKLMIKEMLSLDKLGNYTVGYELSEYIVVFLLSGLLTGLLIAINKHKLANEYKDVRKIEIKYISVLIFFVIPSVTMSGTYFNEVILDFIGWKNHLITDTILIVGFSYFFLYLTYVLVDQHIVRNIHKMKITIKIWFIAAIINLLINYIFLPVYGFISAAYSTLISYIFVYLYHYYYFGRKQLISIHNVSILSIPTILLLIMIVENVYVYEFISGVLNDFLKSIIVLTLYYYIICKIFKRILNVSLFNPMQEFRSNKAK